MKKIKFPKMQKHRENKVTKSIVAFMVAMSKGLIIWTIKHLQITFFPM